MSVYMYIYKKKLKSTHFLGPTITIHTYNDISITVETFQMQKYIPHMAIDLAPLAFYLTCLFMLSLARMLNMFLTELGKQQLGGKGKTKKMHLSPSFSLKENKKWT